MLTSLTAAALLLRSASCCRAGRLVAAALLLCAAAPSQVVHLANSTDSPFVGWVRCTVDRMPPHRAGQVVRDNGDVVPFRLGRPTGLDTRVLDLHVALAPRERVELDLAHSDAEPYTIVAPEPVRGVLAANGFPLDLVSAQPDGAAWIAHLRTRVGRMLHVDVWLRRYPGEPWAHGECLVTCSNPTVADLFVTAGLRLSWGADALLLPLGAEAEQVVPPQTTWADGQARAVPFRVCWPARMEAADWASWGALPELGVVGIARLHPDGSARAAPGFDADAWAAALLPECRRRLHTWERAVLGPNPRSGDTGAQEDQFFHGEPLLSPAAVVPVYLSALKLANRPCHFLELDGGHLRRELHPHRLWFHDGRPHQRVGADMLGKPESFDAGQVPGGWFGPDVEHWFFGRLYEAARLVDSPACQRLLEHQAVLYPLQWSTDPAFVGAYRAFASRARGYEGLSPVRLWIALADRALAERVRSHWRDRWAGPLGRDIAADGERWGDGFADLNPPRWSPWQQAIGAYGVDLAGEVFGVPDARAAALAAARVVLRDGFYLIDARWRTYGSTLRAGGGQDLDGTFDVFGSALAPAVVLRHAPDDDIAGEIAKQHEVIPNDAHARWLAPR